MSDLTNKMIAAGVKEMHDVVVMMAADEYRGASDEQKVRAALAAAFRVLADAYSTYLTDDLVHELVSLEASA